MATSEDILAVMVMVRMMMMMMILLLQLHGAKRQSSMYKLSVLVSLLGSCHML